jgi:hypothetical protein
MASKRSIPDFSGGSKGRPLAFDFLSQSFRQFRHIAKLTFPDPNGPPSGYLENFCGLYVSLSVPLPLFTPVLSIRFRFSERTRAVVPVEKASMNEQCNTVFR